jgi:hypothetical protein
MPSRLIDELVHRGWLTAEQAPLLAAHHAARGGSVDTAVIELRICTEAELLRAMAAAYGLDVATAGDAGAAVDAAALRAFPEQWATRHGLAPLRLDRTRGVLDLLCTVPPDLTLLRRFGDLLELRLRPILAPELRVAQRLALLYGVRPEPRLGVLLDSVGGVGDRPVQAPAPASVAPPPLESGHGLSFGAAVRRLRAATERDEVVAIAVDHAQLELEFAALFAVRPEGVIGWAARGPGAARIEDVTITADASSAYHTAVDSGAHSLGPLTDGDLASLAPLGRTAPRAVLVLPIRIRERVVALLHADNGPHAIPPRVAANLVVFGSHVQRAMEAVLLRRKHADSEAEPAEEATAEPAKIDAPTAGVAAVAGAALLGAALAAESAASAGAEPEATPAPDPSPEAGGAIAAETASEASDAGATAATRGEAEPEPVDPGPEAGAAAGAADAARGSAEAVPSGATDAVDEGGSGPGAPASEPAEIESAEAADEPGDETPRAPEPEAVAGDDAGEPEEKAAEAPAPEAVPADSAEAADETPGETPRAPEPEAVAGDDAGEPEEKAPEAPGPEAAPAESAEPSPSASTGDDAPTEGAAPDPDAGADARAPKAEPETAEAPEDDEAPDAREDGDAPTGEAEVGDDTGTAAPASAPTEPGPAAADEGGAGDARPPPEPEPPDGADDDDAAAEAVASDPTPSPASPDEADADLASEPTSGEADAVPASDPTSDEANADPPTTGEADADPASDPTTDEVDADPASDPAPDDGEGTPAEAPLAAATDEVETPLVAPEAAEPASAPPRRASSALGQAEISGDFAEAEAAAPLDDSTFDGEEDLAAWADGHAAAAWTDPERELHSDLDTPLAGEAPAPPVAAEADGPTPPAVTQVGDEAADEPPPPAPLDAVAAPGDDVAAEAPSDEAATAAPVDASAAPAGEPADETPSDESPATASVVPGPLTTEDAEVTDRGVAPRPPSGSGFEAERTVEIPRSAFSGPPRPKPVLPAFGPPGGAFDDDLPTDERRAVALATGPRLESVAPPTEPSEEAPLHDPDPLPGSAAGDEQVTEDRADVFAALLGAAGLAAAETGPAALRSETRVGLGARAATDPEAEPDRIPTETRRAPVEGPVVTERIERRAVPKPQERATRADTPPPRTDTPPPRADTPPPAVAPVERAEAPDASELARLAAEAQRADAVSASVSAEHADGSDLLSSLERAVSEAGVAAAALPPERPQLHEPLPRAPSHAGALTLADPAAWESVVSDAWDAWALGAARSDMLSAAALPSVDRRDNLEAPSAPESGRALTQELAAASPFDAAPSVPSVPVRFGKQPSTPAPRARGESSFGPPAPVPSQPPPRVPLPRHGSTFTSGGASFVPRPPPRRPSTISSRPPEPGAPEVTPLESLPRDRSVVTARPTPAPPAPSLAPEGRASSIPPVRAPTLPPRPSSRLDMPPSMLREAASSSEPGVDRASAPPAAPRDELDQLLDALTGDDEALRVQARDALSARGVSVLERCAARFPGRLSIDPFAPKGVLPSFAECGELLALFALAGRDAHSFIEPLLDARVPDQRFFATYFYLGVHVPEAVPRLLRRLHDEEPRIATLAVATLGRYRHDEVFSQVRKHLHARLASPSSAARQHAAEFLGRFHDESAVPALIELVDQNDRALAAAAQSALTAITLQTFGRSTRKWSSWWQAHRARPRVEWLIDGLDAKDLDVRRAAIQGLQAAAGMSLGYEEDAPRRSREEARKRWLAWWKRNGRRLPTRTDDRPA